MCLCLIGAALGFLLGAALATSLGLPAYTFGFLGAGMGLFGDIRLFRTIMVGEKQVLRKEKRDDHV